MPTVTVTSIGLCSSSDFITIDQNWHHLYLSSAVRKDLSKDTEIRVTDSIDMHKLLRSLLKNKAKFPATTLSYSMVKIAHVDDAFSEIIKLEASPVWCQSLLLKDKEKRKMKGEKKKWKKSLKM